MPFTSPIDDPLVIFVGAGASMIAPSLLPGWRDFNTTLLECLGAELATYSRNQQPVQQMLQAVTERRDGTAFLSPDFQAQLMEEEIGADYFRVWQSLETDIYGPVHAGIAELAACGRVAAVITTNFDRLIETALAARGVPFDVVHDHAAFERLAGDVTAQPLPVIKIHGSIEDVASLVDTLRQRIIGRPEPLQAALHTLLTRHHWLFLGFSGADLSYDHNYLGIHAAAGEARGFTFLVRPGTPVEAGVRALEAAYAGKGTIVEGDLRTWLSDTFALPPLVMPDAGDRTPDSAHAALRQRVSAWAASLGPLSVVNITCALLRSLQLDEAAHWLLRRTFKRYRTGEDTRAGLTYARYNYNYGLSLLAHGFLGNPVTLADDRSNLLEWKAAADVDARQFFFRAWEGRALHAAGAQLAACTAYLGRTGEAIAISSDVTDRAIASGDPLAYVDVALASVPVYDMIHAYQQALPQLAGCVRTAQRLGDEPRRARALVAFARCCVMTGLFSEATEALAEAERIASRLALADVQRQCRSTRGRLLLDSEQSDADALALLHGVVDELHAEAAAPLFTHVDLGAADPQPDVIRSTPPALCRALLDLNRAARFAGDGVVMESTLDQLYALTTERFPGYLLHTSVAHAQCLLHHGTAASLDTIAACIDDIRSMTASGNPWAATMAEMLSGELEKARTTAAAAP